MKIASLSLLLACFLLGGCFGNPTNEATEQQVIHAKAKRAASIDNDPTLTPAQKEGMKKALGLTGAQGAQRRP